MSVVMWSAFIIRLASIVACVVYSASLAQSLLLQPYSGRLVAMPVPPPIGAVLTEASPAGPPNIRATGDERPPLARTLPIVPGPGVQEPVQGWGWRPDPGPERPPFQAPWLRGSDTSFYTRWLQVRRVSGWDRDRLIGFMMTLILRHEACGYQRCYRYPAETVNLAPNGTLSMDELIAFRGLAWFRVLRTDVVRIINRERKQRFEYFPDPNNPGVGRIRACQGHSGDISAQAVAEEIRPGSRGWTDVAVHGTQLAYCQNIANYDS